MTLQRSIHRRIDRASRGRRGAFTLIEIILAISLAVGLLISAMWFYQTATRYRNELLRQSEQVAAIRQMTDQLAGDLRAIHVDWRHAFTGDSNSLRFVKAVAPSVSPAVMNSPGSDLRTISYRALIDNAGTNSAITGVTRDEVAALDEVAADRDRLGSQPLFDMEGSTNQVEKPMTDAIRHLAFRFWDGTSWRETWNGFTPPPGLEVTLAPEPLSIESTNSESGAEIYRRVIVIPAGQLTKNPVTPGFPPLPAGEGEAP
jgi:type II secretory pathway pseudopilin PulG